MNGCGGFQGMPSVYVVCVCNCVSSGLQVCVCLNVCCLRGCYIGTFACVWLFCNDSVFEGLCLSFPFRARVACCGFWGGNLVCVFAVWEFLRIFFHLLVSVFVWWSGGPVSSWGVL